MVSRIPHPKLLFIPYLDHADVVRTIADCQRHDINTLFDQKRDLSFLFGRHTAADNRFTASSKLQEQFLREFFLECLYDFD